MRKKHELSLSVELSNPDTDVSFLFFYHCVISSSKSRRPSRLFPLLPSDLKAFLGSVFRSLGHGSRTSRPGGGGKKKFHDGSRAAGAEKTGNLILPRLPFRSAGRRCSLLQRSLAPSLSPSLPPFSLLPTSTHSRCSYAYSEWVSRC